MYIYTFMDQDDQKTNIQVLVPMQVIEVNSLTRFGGVQNNVGDRVISTISTIQFIFTQICV